MPKSLQSPNIIAQVQDMWKIAATSGPRVARLFGSLLGAVFLCAWGSLGSQLSALYGRQGLLPIGAFVEKVRLAPDVHFWDVPSLFWWMHSDAALWTALFVGILMAALAMVGLWARPAFFISSLLYMSFATVGRTFMSFQWDNLLIEAGLLTSLLPRDRPSVWAHTLLRLLMFKLYFESGIAKWQSSLGDWRDGSAMLLYFQTAPLPTALAWYAHHLPGMVLRGLSWATLALELAVPWGIFGPRRVRLFVGGALTLFQLVNLATANYGFFCLLSLALHVFLLDENDLPPWLLPHTGRFVARPAAKWGFIVATILYVYLSVGQARAHFTAGDTWTGVDRLAPFRAVNTYHLFGAITRTRLEPEVQVESGQGWAAYDLKYKPGDVHRAPPFVAPHQPRLDFQLWFHGLAPRTWQAYLEALLKGLCDHPNTVQTFFAAPLPPHPSAVRLAYWRYRFTTEAERQDNGAYWSREFVAAMPPRVCGSNPAHE